MRVLYALLFLAILFSAAPATAQMSILFVEDSDDEFGNAETFANAIESVGYPNTFYNTIDSASGPSAEYMSGFDLVIWHTSTDGVGLELWNGADEDNQELVSFLDDGGRLWLVGLDFLFDRYAAPGPTFFEEGEFPYDYLGITSYNVQSQGNDGGLGVPAVAPDTNQVINDLPELTWQFPALNWVDGVDLRPEAAPLYRMAGDNYPLAEAICGVYHDNRTAKVVTYFFDLALVANDQLLQDAVRPVLSFFENFTTSTSANSVLQQDFAVFPNPATGSFSLRVDLENAAVVEVSLLDYLGRVVREPVQARQLPAGYNLVSELDLNNLANGTYFVKLTVEGKSGLRPLVVQN
ncbi:T9SS type A sorting domain-containing protein [Neolewinella aurantiaca]|uniref:T9SS type A sorting domain-containing protein n=1 Tax=Neolewinella aurantiaca TaxID=2602767 RepID=A0A5C7FWI8_9BACT|nr:T9SS type A sorting domain-containing protein [Neolewinella aurantiaca]TXF91025.1 T9SS type A sorting domain-containing protein [Neolewinella aurantiaca]